MISSTVSRASAAYLGVLGVALLFGADADLPRVIPTFPPTAVWLGQLIAAAWLALSAMNWHNRNALLGGIYGRPVVYSNTLLYVISALGTVRAALDPNASPLLWVIAGPAAVFALVYGALMFRGPFDPLTSQKS